MKFFGYALLRARTQPVAFIAAAAAVVVLAVALIAGIAYLLSPVPPYGFYYDLGVDILASSTIAHWLHGWTDFKDALGWAGWGNQNAFAYTPMTSVAVSVFLAKLMGGDAFEAVKAVQVIEVLLSALTAFYLYRVLFGRSPWAWVAAAIYALLAEPLLMIRGNLAFGFTAAFAPLAMAVPLVLVRRYRLMALPLCAAIAALLGAYFTTEHLFLQSIPSYAFAVALAYDRRERGRWVLASIVGFIVLLASLAFVVFPTLASGALFTRPATLGVALGNGEFANYENGLLALASLCINEFIANVRPEFSLGWLLLATVPVGLALWALAIAWVAGAVRRKVFAWGEIPFAVTGLICILLSTGSLIPGLGLTWWAISQIPVLDNIRTPDRFIALGVVVVVMLAVAQLERLSVRPRVAGYAGALAVVLPVTGLVLFFLLRTFLGDTISVEAKEPYLGTITDVAQARGNRVADLGLVDKGSVFDTPLYGAPMPFLYFQNDFAERYEGDGLGGVGLLARGNVATIVATPPWTPDSPLLGQSSLARAAFLKPVAGDATTVAAYGVDPVRGYVEPVTEACIFGGPGLLDNIVALPVFDGTAFLIGARTCPRAVYADAAPPEAVVGGTFVYPWTAVTLFPHSGVMRDIDYRVALGRFLINVPWYRNSIDGDSPVFSPAAVSLDTGDRASSIFEIGRAGSYSFAMHIVCHGEMRGRIEIDRRMHSFACAPARGLQWVNVPIGRMIPGLHSANLFFDRIDETSPEFGTTWRLAFDGAAIVLRSKIVPLQPTAYVFSASRFRDRSFGSAPYGSLNLVAAHGMEPIGAALPDGIQPLLARTPDAVATYRWRGVPGRYRVWATAYSESGFQAASYVGVYTRGTCCTQIATAQESSGTSMLGYGDVTLRDGGNVHVTVHTAPNDPSSIAQLLSVVAEPDPLPARPIENRSRVAADFPFAERVRHMSPEIPTGPTPVPGHNGIDTFYGMPLGPPLTLHASFPSETADSPTTLYVSIRGDGPAHASLACGKQSMSASISAPGGELALAPSGAGVCSVTISSGWAKMYVQDVSVSRPMDAYDLDARRWLAAGIYRVIRVRRGGATANGVVAVDGRKAGETIRIARDGVHAIEWNAAPADAYLVAFVPRKWPTPAAPVRSQAVASARWRVTLERRATLETAVFPDGYWRLSGRSASFAGHPCDLENSCFSNVPAGTYTLLHVWPSYIKLGFLVTLLAWLIALAMFTAARRQASEGHRAARE